VVKTCHLVIAARRKITLLTFFRRMIEDIVRWVCKKAAAPSLHRAHHFYAKLRFCVIARRMVALRRARLGFCRKS
jgi:hypothetical protein